MNKSKGNSKPKYRDKEWLKEKYLETKSIYKVAEMCGCSYRTIHQWLIKYDIERIGRIGYKHSDETKNKISKSSVGKKPMLGKKHSKETRRKMSIDRRGKGNSNWKGGKTKIIREFRKSKEYVNWRKEVLELEAYKCNRCKTADNLEVHHIVSLNEDFSKALDIDNGMVLCTDCHKEEHRRDKSE